VHPSFRNKVAAPRRNDPPEQRAHPARRPRVCLHGGARWRRRASVMRRLPSPRRRRHVYRGSPRTKCFSQLVRQRPRCQRTPCVVSQHFQLYEHMFHGEPRHTSPTIEVAKMSSASVRNRRVSEDVSHTESLPGSLASTAWRRAARTNLWEVRKKSRGHRQCWMRSAQPSTP